MKRIIIAALTAALAALLLAAPAQARTAAPIQASTARPVFPVYYLWWSGSHWHDRLGPNYPYSATPSPLPATLDSSGCSAHSNYSGNTLTDVSQGLAYDQTKASTIESDVRLAATLGVKGFAVNWIGTGGTGQSPTSSSDDTRLQWMFDAVHKVNAEGIPFKLVLNYKASATVLTTGYINNDLGYFRARYASDSALDHSYSPRPEVWWAGSWKYTAAQMQTVSSANHASLYLIGDEKPSTWTATRASYLDGTGYYWSSQNPYSNPGSFTQLQNLAATVHGQGKAWFAPFTPGYNAQLLYGTSTCVSRNSGQTMHTLFQGNLRSNPDGWFMISWNEIAEGSYIVPLTRYGQLYTDTLKSIIANNG
jgi:hypothetical protein